MSTEQVLEKILDSDEDFSDFTDIFDDSKFMVFILIIIVKQKTTADNESDVSSGSDDEPGSDAAEDLGSPHEESEDLEGKRILLVSLHIAYYLVVLQHYLL